jgi:hypothetical protein
VAISEQFAPTPNRTATTAADSMRSTSKGVGLEHLSLILLPTLPAYNGAQVVSLSARSAADQRRHEESERIIRECAETLRQADMARIRREAAARPGRVA